MIWVGVLAAGLAAIGGVWLYVLTAGLWWDARPPRKAAERAEAAWKWTAEVVKRPAGQLPYRIKSIGGRR